MNQSSINTDIEQMINFLMISLNFACNKKVNGNLIQITTHNKEFKKNQADNHVFLKNELFSFLHFFLRITTSCKKREEKAKIAKK